MDKNYFKKNEKTDYEKLIDFNSIKHFFNRLDKTPAKHDFDASGDTKDGRLTAIELKSRNALLTKENTVSGSNFNDNTVFIEDYKMAALLAEFVVTKAVPLYINFLSDGTVLIWNLSKLSTVPQKIPIIIKNNGYGQMEKAYRYLLKVDDAMVYKPLITTN